MKKQAILHETAVVSSRGQVVLPKPLREAIGVHAGNEIVFSLYDNGEISMKVQERNIEMFFGRAKCQEKKSLSIDEIDEAIAQAVSDESKES